MNRQVLHILHGNCSKLLVLACAMTTLLLLSSPSPAQTIKVSSQPGPQSIAANIEYYEDASESLSIEDVLSPNFSVNFLPHNRDILHFGITSSAYWIRFNLDWSETQPGVAKILEFGPPKIVAGVIRGGIELFVVDDDGKPMSNYVLGTLESSREIITLSRGFAIILDPSFGNNFYLRVTSARPLRLPINLWSIDEYSNKSIISDLFLGLQYAVLLAMIFYTLFLFVSIRENS